MIAGGELIHDAAESQPAPPWQRECPFGEWVFTDPTGSGTQREAQEWQE